MKESICDTMERKERREKIIMKKKIEMQMGNHLPGGVYEMVMEFRDMKKERGNLQYLHFLLKSGTTVFLGRVWWVMDTSENEILGFDAKSMERRGLEKRNKG